MVKNNTMRERSRKCKLLVVFVFCLISIHVFSQDPLPSLPKVMAPGVWSEQSQEYKYPAIFVPVGNSMPSSFKNTTENIIEDNGGILFSFFEKLRRNSEPIRIVHIGDSHVRGHLFTQTVRRRFERDFGAEAVFPDSISYFTSGLLRETGRSGIVYHTIGINGAFTTNFANVMQAREVAKLKPDLIILSFGTNESQWRGYGTSRHESDMTMLINMLREFSPEAAILLTTPPGSYLRQRRKYTINPRTTSVAHTIVGYAKKNGFASWDLYTIVGGHNRAAINWFSNNYMRPDRIHFTEAGYRLQGNLLYEALIKAYNTYVGD